MEGMEDEDMKKETQNLAYSPAFKLGELLRRHRTTGTGNDMTRDQTKRAN